MNKKPLITKGKGGSIQFSKHQSFKKRLCIRGMLTILLTIISVSFLFASCRKSESPVKEEQGHVSKKEAILEKQVSETRIKETSTLKTSQIPVKDQNITKSLTKDSKLSKEEQKGFKEIFGQESMTEEQALQNFSILFKGGPETITYYQDPRFGDEKGRCDKYSDDFCTVIQRLANLKSPKGYHFILDMMKEKMKFPKVRACAAEAIGWYGELKKGKWYGDKRAIPALKEIINDKDPEIRLQAAGSLLSLGECDIALPVLDELAKAGIHQSTFALNKLFTLEEMEEDGRKRIVISHTKLWDDRGEKILIKALHYSSECFITSSAEGTIENQYFGDKGAKG